MIRHSGCQGPPDPVLPVAWLVGDLSDIPLQDGLRSIAINASERTSATPQQLAHNLLNYNNLVFELPWHIIASAQCYRRYSPPPTVYLPCKKLLSFSTSLDGEILTPSALEYNRMPKTSSSQRLFGPHCAKPDVGLSETQNSMGWCSKSSSK